METEVKDTGNAIAREYEHRLIMDSSIDDQAEAMGIKLISEHDGFVVFAKDNYAALESEFEHVRLWGVIGCRTIQSRAILQLTSNRLSDITVFEG